MLARVGPLPPVWLVPAGSVALVVSAVFVDSS